jgi:predicted phage replisome organizer
MLGESEVKKMGETKKFYWLKLKTNFFTSKEIKKLRKIAGGDTFTIIYLKMLLLSVKTEGKLYYENVEDSFAEELALELDEDVENVSVVLNYLERYKLMERGSETEFLLNEAVASLGSETQGAERVRRFREKHKALQCNGDVTQPKLLGNTEIEIELEKEIDKDIDISKKSTRHKYGTYKNVLLSDEELKKLKSEFVDWEERIERVSEYVASRGKGYNNYLATIRAWARAESKRSVNRGYNSRNASTLSKSSISEYSNPI